MSIRKGASIAALVCLLAALGSMIYVRGFSLQLGGTPAALQSEHKTEEDWITNEIVRDVTEMSAFARGTSGKSVSANVTSAQNGIYRVSSPALLKSEQTIQPGVRMWSPDRFSPLVEAILTGVQPAQNARQIVVHQRLVELTPENIATASRNISAALKTHMADAQLHDASALVIGAFGLRESSGRFHDVRRRGSWCVRVRGPCHP